MARNQENAGSGIQTQKTGEKRQASGATITREAEEPLYTSEELVHAARKKFGVSPELLAAALFAAGKTEATVTETKKLVQDFKNRRIY